MLPALAVTPGCAFGIYVHVPFCATRCGYCDFNTYTSAELGGSSPDGWLAALRAELGIAAAAVGPVPVDTVFVGGGTPSLLGAGRLAGGVLPVAFMTPPRKAGRITSSSCQASRIRHSASKHRYDHGETTS